MKTFATAVMLGVFAISGLIMTGCATPGYSGGEETRRVLRNWGYENEQMIDDINSALLLDPPSRMTIWNLR